MAGQMIFFAFFTASYSRANPVPTFVPNVVDETTTLSEDDKAAINAHWDAAVTGMAATMMFPGGFGDASATADTQILGAQPLASV